MSDIKKVKFGLGLTRYDEDVMEFQDYYNRSMLWIPASMLPVGKYMYGRLRAVNNGESSFFSLACLDFVSLSLFLTVSRSRHDGLQR
jgi:hypothetical protein